MALFSGICSFHPTTHSHTFTGVSKVPLSLNEVIRSINFNRMPLLAQAACLGREQISDTGEAERGPGADTEGRGRCQRGGGRSPIARSPPCQTEKMKSYVTNSRSVMEDMCAFIWFSTQKTQTCIFTREIRVLNKVKLVVQHRCLIGTSFVLCSVVDAVGQRGAKPGSCFLGGD